MREVGRLERGQRKGHVHHRMAQLVSSECDLTAHSEVEANSGLESAARTSKLGQLYSIGAEDERPVFTGRTRFNQRWAGVHPRVGVSDEGWSA